MFHKTPEQMKGDLWTMIFPFWNILVKAIDMPLNCVHHLDSAASITAWSLSEKEDSEIPATSTFIYYIWKDLSIHFHLFYFTLLYYSRSRCMKYILWNGEAKRLSIWGMEIKVWMNSPYDPELTCLTVDDWNCADTGRYKRQKNGIKPYLLLTCLYFPTPTSNIKKKKNNLQAENKSQSPIFCTWKIRAFIIFHTAFSCGIIIPASPSHHWELNPTVTYWRCWRY